MQNSKWSKKLRLQFPLLFGLDIFAVQPNFITGSIALRLDAFIIGLLPKLLSVVEVFFGLRARVDVFFIRHLAMIATI